MRKIAIRDAADHIVARAEFNCHGALRGTGINSYDGIQHPGGLLPEPHRSAFRKGAPYMARPGTLDRHVLYVVFSYDTPIAWFTKADGWVIPDVKYSVTTSRHQSAVRRALA